MKTQKPNIVELAQRASGLVSTTQLAEYYKVSHSLVSQQARKLGFPPLKRGRKAFTKPTDLQIEILKALRTETFQAVASRYGYSRQYVWSLAKRWPDYPLPKDPQVVEIEFERPQPVQIPIIHKEVRPHVVSFRLTASQMHRLCAYNGGKTSTNKAARQLLDKALELVAPLN